jgi:DNA-binding transcriptional regulator YbjK
VSDPEVRRHRPSAQARRDALLRAAVDVAAERGAAGVTHRAVTERAGLPLATVSYFFSSIDDLVAEALHTFVTDEVTRLSELAETLAADESSPDDLTAVLPAALAEAAMPAGPLPWTLTQFETYLQAARGEALRPAASGRLSSRRTTGPDTRGGQCRSAVR